jgi:DNA-binding NtrC family response regulator
MSSSPIPVPSSAGSEATDRSKEYRIRGITNPRDPYEKALQRVVNLVRRCDLVEAVSLAGAVRDGAAEAGRFEVAARASSYLGEVAGIRGDLDVAFREYSHALGYFEHTTFAASTSRALRGFAQAYYMADFPSLALDYAQRARQYLALIDRRDMRRRCEFECAIWEGLALLALGRLSDAWRCVRMAQALEREMAAVDDWLVGLSWLLRGKFDVESGSRAPGGSSVEAGIRRLAGAVVHCDEAGLVYWTAVCQDALARALGGLAERVDEAHAVMTAALATFERAGVQVGALRARDWLRVLARRDRTVPKRLAPQETTVEGACVSGPKMRAAVNSALVVADDEVPVLVVGETGTGKTAIARIIHTNSQRATAPFVTVMCSHLTREMAQAELFGHAKGAFTSAIMRRPGKFREAEGGTIFLDEIHTLDSDVQAMILRAIETGVIQPLGEPEARVDVRVITATNVDIETEVSEGRFKLDLYHRLNCYTIRVAPLRERGEEIFHLAQHFAEARGMTVSMGAYDVLREHAWPGNVRELQNVIRASSIQARAEGDTTLTREYVEQALRERRISPPRVDRPPSRPTQPSAAEPAPWPFHFITPEGLIPENEIIPRFNPADPRKGAKAKALQRAVAEFKRFVILRHLEKHNGNRFRVARELEENLPTLLHMMNSLGMGEGADADGSENLAAAGFAPLDEPEV